MKSSKIRAAQKAGKFTVLFDSGIRTGSDIIKAIALGAQAVLRKLFSWKSLPEALTWLNYIRSGPAMGIRRSRGRTGGH